MPGRCASPAARPRAAHAEHPQHPPLQPEDQHRRDDRDDHPDRAHRGEVWQLQVQRPAGHVPDPGEQGVRREVEAEVNAGGPRAERAGMVVGAENGDELHHHDQRAGGGLGQGETTDHVAGGQPAVVLHRPLRHTACATMAITAGANPANSAVTTVVSPKPT
jgi:hypothetical protein